MPEPTIASELRRIQVALARQSVECPDHRQDCVTRQIRCKGSGRIPNSAVAGFLALAQGEREGIWSHCDCKSMGLCQNLYADGTAPRGITDCHGSGFVLRTAYWDVAPDGAIALPLLQAAREAGMSGGGKVLLIAWNSCEPNLVALTAVATWLEGLPKREVANATA